MRSRENLALFAFCVWECEKEQKEYWLCGSRAVGSAWLGGSGVLRCSPGLHPALPCPALPAQPSLVLLPETALGAGQGFTACSAPLSTPQQRGASWGLLGSSRELELPAHFHWSPGALLALRSPWQLVNLNQPLYHCQWLLAEGRLGFRGIQQLPPAPSACSHGHVVVLGGRAGRCSTDFQVYKSSIPNDSEQLSLWHFEPLGYQWMRTHAGSEKKPLLDLEGGNFLHWNLALEAVALEETLQAPPCAHAQVNWYFGWAVHGAAQSLWLTCRNNLV